MLLSTETNSIVKRFGEEKAFEMLKRTGFDACDFSFYNSGVELLDDDYMENARRTKELLCKAGLLCNQAHAPIDMVEEDSFDISCRNYKNVLRSIEYAAYIGAKNIIIHLICTKNRGDLYRYNREYYKSLEPYAEKFGIKIAVENDFERRNGKVLPVLDYPEEYGEFIEKLDSDWLVGCIDIGHAAMFNDPAEFVLKTNGSFIKALHVHDNDLIEDLHLFPLTGQINWYALCDALKKVNYTGDFTFEAIKSFDRIPNELIEDTLIYLAKMGRYLMNLIKA